MKSSTKTTVCASAPALLLTIALAGFACADAQATLNGSSQNEATDFLQREIIGSLQGHETDMPQGNPPQQLLVNGEVKGRATHLGRFTITYNLTVSLPAGIASGSATLIVANGDTIHTTVVGYGKAVPGIPGLNRIVEINTITGGTGRFTNAQGSFLVERLVDLNTGLTSGSLRNT